MFEFNRNVEQRDAILFGDDTPLYYGGIARFERLPVDALEMLVEMKFADPEDTQNDSPSIQEFLEFMQQHAEVLAHGYAVSIDREDYRASIEGLQVDRENMTVGLLEDFVAFCRFADDFMASMEHGCYAWWD